MHYMNTFFGHLHVLARYVGEPDRMALAYLQHGWEESDPMADQPHLSFVPKLMWNERNVEGARAAGLSNFVLVGAEYLYLEGGRVPGPVTATVDRDVIVYPYHSWDYDTSHPADRDPKRDERYADGHTRYAAMLAERETGTVTVALYWRDHCEDAARVPYEEAGFRVITHGNRFDRDFLLNQRGEQLGHRRVVTNRLGTAAWYAAHAGCALEVYGPFAGASPDEARYFERRQRARWPALFDDGGVDVETARALADDELGARWKREPEELAEILGWRGWRRRITPLVELVDRAHHKVRFDRHRRRSALLPEPWANGE